jgi:hypothetical protein
VLYAAPTWGEIEGLPSASDDTIYIVSMLVAQRCAGRRDVFCPGTGPNDGCIRDEKGRIQAVTRLIRAPKGDCYNWQQRQLDIYGTDQCRCGSGLSPEECCG